MRPAPTAHAPSPRLPAAIPIEWHWLGRPPRQAALVAFFMILTFMAALARSPAHGATSEPFSANPRTAAFPVSAAPDGRYLIDGSGTPYFLHGDAGWSLIADLTSDEAKIYLADRRQRGFNTIVVNLLERQFARLAPRNASGEPPFKIAGDFATPNDAYFDHAVAVIEEARRHGLLVLLAPAYLGARGGPEGWYQEMRASGADKLRSYGRYVGQRFQSLDNIIWVIGGDYSPPEREIVRAVADGIREFDRKSLFTFHPTPETSARDYWGSEPGLDLDMVYTYEAVHIEAARVARGGGATPFILFETHYEAEWHGADEHRIRLQAYEALLSGACGQVFGNNPIWHFGGPGLTPTSVDWRAALSSRGAESMTHLGRLFSALPWWRLAPDLDGHFLVEGQGAFNSRAVAAVDKAGGLALVYVPSERRIMLDLSRVGPDALDFHWFDPSSGRTSKAKPPLPRAHRRAEIATPGPNDVGMQDWLLLVTDKPASRALKLEE